MLAQYDYNLLVNAVAGTGWREAHASRTAGGLHIARNRTAQYRSVPRKLQASSPIIFTEATRFPGATRWILLRWTGARYSSRDDYYTFATS